MKKQIFIIFVLALSLIPLTPLNAERFFVPEVAIPGSETNEDDKSIYKIELSTSAIGIYIKDLYNYGISIVGIVAAIAFMVGGVIWLTAGGSAQKVGQAKEWIIGALTGLTLALTSYLILQTINPNLVDFQISEVPRIEEEIIEPSTTGSICSMENNRFTVIENIKQLDDKYYTIGQRTQSETEYILKENDIYCPPGNQCVLMSDDIRATTNRRWECENISNIKCCEYGGNWSDMSLCPGPRSAKSCFNTTTECPTFEYNNDICPLREVYESNVCDQRNISSHCIR